MITPSRPINSIVLIRPAGDRGTIFSGWGPKL